MWTEANTWFSTEQGKKGQIKAGQLADLAVLSDDYFSVPEKGSRTSRRLTVLGGKPVYGDGDFKDLAPRLPPPMPDWSPVRIFRRLSEARREQRPHETYVRGGLWLRQRLQRARPRARHSWAATVPVSDKTSFWGAIGCSCWAF